MLYEVQALPHYICKLQLLQLQHLQILLCLVSNHNHGGLFKLIAVYDKVPQSQHWPSGFVLEDVTLHLAWVQIFLRKNLSICSCWFNTFLFSNRELKTCHNSRGILPAQWY